MLRILHIGLGPLGRMIAADITRRSSLRITAAVDVSPDIAGRRLVEFAPGSSPDLTILSGLTTIRAGDFDAAIVATSSDLARCMPTFRDLLRRGIPVVSTCEELLFPWLRHKPLADELASLCKEHKARILGTGVNPGFLMDALPVAATAVCRTVKSVKCSRIQDASPRRLPFQKKIGAGLSDSDFAARIADGSLRHVGLGESLHFIAHYLNLPIERWTETIEPVKAERDLIAGLGPIPRGRAAGVRQVAKGWSPGAPASAAPLIELEFQAAIAQHDPHDRVQIDGEPPIDLILRGGVHGDIATSAITLNAIPALLASPPGPHDGLHTMATIPMVRCCGG